MSTAAKDRDCRPLSALRNVGKATLADFHLLGVATVSDLATRDADALYVELERITGGRQDPCVHDVFSATIHEASTGEAKNWWEYTPARKARQVAGSFPAR